MIRRSAKVPTIAQSIRQLCLRWFCGCWLLYLTSREFVMRLDSGRPFGGVWYGNEIGRSAKDDAMVYVQLRSVDYKSFRRVNTGTTRTMRRRKRALVFALVDVLHCLPDLNGFKLSASMKRGVPCIAEPFDFDTLRNLALLSSVKQAFSGPSCTTSSTLQAPLFI